MPLHTQRLDKLLVNCGLGSRSQVKVIIRKKEITVNGEPAKDGEQKIDTENDVVAHKGQALIIKQHLYLMMNKPSGVVCATDDNLSETVIDIIPKRYRRKGLFPVGRLDKDTEGLLLITDDGDFSHRITSPKTKTYKVYQAVLDKPVTPKDIDAFKNGIVMRDGTEYLPAKLSIINDDPKPLVEVEICQGKFHQVKKMFISRGIKVIYLKRTKIGNLKLDENLTKGECRELEKLEINNI